MRGLKTIKYNLRDNKRLSKYLNTIYLIRKGSPPEKLIFFIPACASISSPLLASCNNSMSNSWRCVIILDAGHHESANLLSVPLKSVVHAFHFSLQVTLPPMSFCRNCWGRDSRDMRAINFGNHHILFIKCTFRGKRGESKFENMKIDIYFVCIEK